MLWNPVFLGFPENMESPSNIESLCPRGSKTPAPPGSLERVQCIPVGASPAGLPPPGSSPPQQSSLQAHAHLCRSYFKCLSSSFEIFCCEQEGRHHPSMTASHPFVCTNHRLLIWSPPPWTSILSHFVTLETSSQ